MSALKTALLAGLCAVLVAAASNAPAIAEEGCHDETQGEGLKLSSLQSLY